MRAVASQLVQLAVAALGGFALHVAGLPAAWLTGSVIAVCFLGVTGHAQPLPRALSDVALLTSGAVMGAAMTPEALEAVARYPLSLLTLALAVLFVTLGSALWLVRVAGWGRDDALLASVPGALTTVMAVAVERGASVGRIAIVQSFRLFVLLTVMPSAVVLAGAGAEPEIAGAPSLPMSPGGFAAIMLGGLAAAFVLERARVAAPTLLGGALVSTGLHAAGLAPGEVPPLLSAGAFVLIGVYIGERFRLLDRLALRRTIKAAAGSFAVGMGLSALFAALAAKLAGVGLPAALVAFAPGALEGMIVLGVVLGLDPLFVGVHHLARFLGIALILPLAMISIRPSPPGQAGS